MSSTGSEHRQEDSVTDQHPPLHDLVTVLRAPEVVLSGDDGQVRREGAQGWYHGDRRALAVLELDVDHGRLISISRRSKGPEGEVFHGVANLDPETLDPTVTVQRRRTVSREGLTERIELTNHGAGAAVTVQLRVATDLTRVDSVKAGRATPLAAASLHGDEIRWKDGEGRCAVRFSPTAEASVADDVATLRWQIDLGHGETWSAELRGTSSHTAKGVFEPVPPSRSPQWTPPEHELAQANLRDVEALLLSDPDAPEDLFAAAGSPWYLTLFGRDSLWTARLLLPLGTDLAAGTLRTLARRQGKRHDPETEEAPGKIPHKARSAPIDTGDVRVAALYYGTIDATPLWVRLLHEAWLAGMAEDEVVALLPNLTAAMDWITSPDADPDGDGLLEYVGSTSGGLTNQGWKDSHDGVRHLDGRRAKGPLALCEVQGYGYAAARGAAALANAFDLEGGPQWLDWAEVLRTRFHAAYWIDDAHGRYPAIALDGDNEPVDGAASNMAHLLGTGILDTHQARDVAHRLAHHDLTTDFGLRTLSTESAAFNPVSYHCGSVWPHDTAIAVNGLVAEAQTELAERLARGIVNSTRHFGGRAPELYAVIDDVPMPYPTACSPQAWSAAGVVSSIRHLRSSI
jgi:hypothetical protein